ncbi:LacI family DNA-binding transcriptional regulator [Streptomyces zhihengii]
MSEETRSLVEAAIAELGYVPNRAARALAANRTDAVALVVPESQDRFFSEPYFSHIVRGAGAGLAGTGMQLLLTLAPQGRERDTLAQYLAADRVDGVLLVSVHAGDPLPDQLAALSVPVVISGRRSADEPLAAVDSDNFEGAREAVAHLAARGGAPSPRSPVRWTCTARSAGWTATARPSPGRPRRRPRLTAEADFSEEGGRRAMRALLDGRPDLDAVFAASDVMAAGARATLREAGRRVPEDVALVGFDDSAVARHMDPPLTSVRQPIEEMGRTMARVLLDEIATPSAPPRRPRIVLPTRLVVRESS